ncbi:hypothetical protein A6X21_19045 [Planctopirus hydrillae]|uniref:Nucleotide-diphospho-sugar transferase domain-containing protein n=2 Tax=Planctopirus hydrillae TaxID=1841610 RepID=A0A1C3EI99_9PLAN|nr:hypothetical protein A6X21_19045 [Planctopirus hydrillae]
MTHLGTVNMKSIMNTLRPRKTRHMEYSRAFAVISNSCYFPGILATLGSIYAYYGRDLRVYVVGHGLSAAERQILQSTNLGASLTLIDTEDFSNRPIGCWEAKQQCASELVGSVKTISLLDADLILLSRIDDVFELAERGKIVAPLDCGSIGFNTDYDIYSSRLAGCVRPNLNTGFVTFHTRMHWDLVALWAFTSRFGAYSPGRGMPLSFPGHGDQGIFNALLCQLHKDDAVHVLPERTWTNSVGWNRGHGLRIVARHGHQITAEHQPGGLRQRVLHSSGPKWWTPEGQRAFSSAGDVLTCFEEMSRIALPNSPASERSTPRTTEAPPSEVSLAVST